MPFVIRYGPMARRPLTALEIAEARTVFDSSLDYTQAFVYENAAWPDALDKLAARLQRRMRYKDEHNAITLGTTSYFPVTLKTDAAALAANNLSDFSWLVHELTHQLQYRRQGWSYLFGALGVQIRLGRKAYDYREGADSPQAALQAARAAGHKLSHFNLEQQGDLARDFYLRRRWGENCDAWEPFIQEMR
jgi:hypothetical protein